MPKKNERKPLSKLTTSWVGRNTRLASTATKVLGKLAKGSMQKLIQTAENSDLGQVVKVVVQEKIAEDIADTLSELKGLAMKAGQIMSYLDFTLPEGAREILSKLQDSTTPMEPHVVEEIIEKELGKKPQEIFGEWLPKPFAAASIGQVHLAKLKDGTEVAVKVQYPEIDRSIETDLKNVKIIDLMASTIFRHQDKGAVLSELRERLLEECDYTFEAKNQEKFKNLYRDNSNVIIPEVFREYSSKRVLTTRFYKAKRFKDFQISATQQEKNKAAEIIWDFAFESIFKHHLFNADPHPGNYLFTDEGQVVFLDFGCVKSFDEALIDHWKEMAKATLAGDKSRLKDLLIEGRIVPKPESFDFDYHYHMMRALYTPWREDVEFRFTHEFVQKTIEDLVAKNPNKFKMNLPKDWVFVNRLQWGLHSVLAMLGANSNWHRRILPLLK